MKATEESEVERLLCNGLVPVPEAFEEAVMTAVLSEKEMTIDSSTKRKKPPLLSRAQHAATALAIAAGAIAASVQTVSYVLGLWAIRARA